LLPVLKVLHVEDDDGDAKHVQRALAKEFDSKCVVVRVSSLNEAVRKLKESLFNAVLLDLNLTDVCGLANVRAVKEADPELPIVVLSGHDDKELALDALRQGAQEYLVKGHADSRVVCLAVLSSIERKAYERKLFQQANFDELTGLPNRRMFFDYMERWLVRAQRWKRTEAVLFLDIDGFKKVNDTLGHDVGDDLLREVARRLKMGLRASDMLARLGGDEFVIHVDGDGQITRPACSTIAEKITENVTAPVVIGNHTIGIGLSVGIAFYPEHGRDVASLMQSADKAMYEAKRRRTGHCFAPAGR
jgi:diguanylate cyclase (GGDEF)-like protein